jgi:hypothetical protein
MAARPEALATPVKLSYTPLGDTVTGQVGAPARGRIARLNDDFDVFVRRDDPSELVGFELRNFRRRFRESDRRQLSTVLGMELLKSLDALHIEVRDVERERSIATREDLAQALEQRVVMEAVLPPSTEPVREGRRRAVEDAWEQSVAAATAEAELPALLLAIDEWLRLSDRWESLRAFVSSRPTAYPDEPWARGHEPAAVFNLATAMPSAPPPSARTPRSYRSELTAAIGRAIARLRTSTKTSPSRVVQVAVEEFGLSWTESSLRQLERGRRTLTVDEFLLLPLVLSRSLGRPVELRDLVGDVPDRVEVTPLIDLAGRDIAALLSGDSAGIRPFRDNERAWRVFERSSSRQSSYPTREPIEWLAFSPSLRNVEHGFRQLQEQVRESRVPEPRAFRVIADMMRRYTFELEPSARTTELREFRNALELFERAAATLASSREALPEGTEALREGLAHWRSAIAGLERQVMR